MRVSRGHYRLLLLLCLVLSLPGQDATAAPGAQQTDKMVFGILPSRSTITMFNRFAPLRDYLAAQLNKQIIFETAPDYDIFLHRSRYRKYDFILTAPHFALLTMDSGHYEIAATYRDPLAAVILTRNDSKLKNLTDLAGKTISIPPDRAIITMAGKYYLMKSGLTGNNEPVYRSYTTHSASLHAMLSGETDAAIISNNVSRHAIKKKQPVRIISRSPNIPGMAILVAKNLPEKSRNNFSHLLLNMHNSSEGRQVLKKINYPGYRKASPKEFDSVRLYLNKYWK